MLCNKLDIPHLLSFETCTDTGRSADFFFTISSAMGNVPTPDLPVTVTALEYMEQKATIDAIFSLSLGLFTYVNPVPSITITPNLISMHIRKYKEITGGQSNLKTGPVKAAEAILSHIESIRKMLGI